MFDIYDKGCVGAINSQDVVATLHHVSLANAPNHVWFFQHISACASLPPSPVNTSPSLRVQIIQDLVNSVFQSVDLKRSGK